MAATRRPMTVPTSCNMTGVPPPHSRDMDSSPSRIEELAKCKPGAAKLPLFAPPPPPPGGSCASTSGSSMVAVPIMDSVVGHKLPVSMTVGKRQLSKKGLQGQPGAADPDAARRKKLEVDRVLLYNSLEDLDHSLDGNGFHCMNLFLYLWATNLQGRPCPLVMVPDTLIIQQGMPRFWFNTVPSFGVRRVDQPGWSHATLLWRFMASVSRDIEPRTASTSKVKGLHVAPGTVLNSSDPGVTLKHYDMEGLEELAAIARKHCMPDGMLQRFVKPTTGNNVLLVANWRTYSFYVNSMALHTRAAKKGDLTMYNDQGCFLPGYDVPLTIRNRIQEMCDTIVDHVYDVSPQKYRITAMCLVFKTDRCGNIWLLWCSHMMVKKLSEVPLQRRVKDGMLHGAATMSMATAMRATSQAAKMVSLSSKASNMSWARELMVSRPKKGADGGCGGQRSRQRIGANKQQLATLGQRSSRRALQAAALQGSGGPPESLQAVRKQRVQRIKQKKAAAGNPLSSLYLSPCSTAQAFVQVQVEDNAARKAAGGGKGGRSQVSPSTRPATVGESAPAMRRSSPRDWGSPWQWRLFPGSCGAILARDQSPPRSRWLRRGFPADLPGAGDGEEEHAPDGASSNAHSRQGAGLGLPELSLPALSTPNSD